MAVEPGNEWFVTGSADRTMKIWDLATGQLKLTLTGHIEQASAHAAARALTCQQCRSRPSLHTNCTQAMQVTGLAVSPNHPYVFSCGLDKMVKCWDMEYNKVCALLAALQGMHTACAAPAA